MKANITGTGTGSEKRIDEKRLTGVERLVRDRSGLPVALMLVCALSLLSFAMLLFRIEAQSLWWDETLSFHRANGSISYILSNQIVVRDVVTIDQHPPLYFLLLHFALKLFGPSEFALRFPSAAAALLLVPVSYRLGRAWFNHHVGLAVALVSAISPYLIAYGQEARSYALVALLGGISLYLLKIALDTRRLRWYLAWALVGMASLLTHYLAAILLALEAALIAAYVVRRRRRAALLLAPLAALALPAVSYLSNRYSVWLVERARLSPVDMLRDIALTYSLGPAADQRVWWPYALGLGLLLAAGAWASRKPRLGLALPAGLGTAMVVFYALGPLPATTRYAAPLAVAYFLLLGLGVAFLSQRRWVGALAAAYLISGSAVGLNEYFFVHDHAKQDFRGVADYVNRHSLPGDVVLLTSSNMGPAFDYYRLGDLPIYGLPEPSGHYRLGSAGADLADIGARYERVWWVRAMTHEDRADWVQGLLDRQFSTVDEKRFDGDGVVIFLRLYQTQPYSVEAPPPHATKLGVAFGGAATAEAFEVGWADAQQSRLRVTIYWRARQESIRSANVSVQLVDSLGQAWGASGKEPLNGFYPMSRWRHGELVADHVEIRVTPGAPPGKYRLRLGVQELGNGPVLEANDQAGNALGQHPEIGDISLTLPSSVARSAGLAGAVKRADFGDSLGLLQVDGVRESLPAGGTLRFRLWWEAYSNPGPAQARLRLVDAAGSTFAEATLPLSGLYPSEQWQVGDLVGADYNLRVPVQTPAGAYRLALSLVKTDSGEAVPVGEGWWPFGGVALDLGAVQVEQMPQNTVLPAESLAVAQKFGGGIELAALGADSGWELSSNENGTLSLRPTSARPEALPLSLYWRADQPIEDDYTVTVQLLDANGRLVDQHDSVPAEGARRTSGWRPDEVIEDKHVLSKLSSLPPGDYTLIAGLYKQPGLQRLPTVDGKDHCRLAIVKY